MRMNGTRHQNFVRFAHNWTNGMLEYWVFVLPP